MKIEIDLDDKTVHAVDGDVRVEVQRLEAEQFASMKAPFLEVYLLARAPVDHVVDPIIRKLEDRGVLVNVDIKEG